MKNTVVRPEGVYVRQGASTVPASDTAILQMIKETSGDSYEEARSLNQHLTFNKTKDFFQSRSIELEKVQMRTLHFLGTDDMYTNLAFLLSEQCTQSLKIAVFEGSKKSVFKDRREFTGSLLYQMEEAYDYIDRYNRTRAEFSGLNRIDLRDYPPEAIREALLNAIVHRDYSFNSSILISIFEDRMEFVTIGGLVKGITLDDVKLGISVLRNPHLANVFYRLRLIEAYGTGILKMNECYSDFRVKPIIETTDHAFKITLPNTNSSVEEHMYEPQGMNFAIKEVDTKYSLTTSAATSGMKKRERVYQILELCRCNGFLVRSDVEALLGVSQATAILLLRELTEEGVLLKTGKSKNIRYYESKSCWSEDNV
jgi:ATP-dependent DNA helicase RecG